MVPALEVKLRGFQHVKLRVFQPPPFYVVPMEVEPAAEYEALPP